MLYQNTKCWLTAKATRQLNAAGQQGIYAVQLIAKDECIWAWSDPLVALALPTTSFLGPLMYAYLSQAELGGDCFRHSCDPNAGFRGVLELVAMRDILPTEPITFDLALCLPFDFGRLTCRCGAARCRRVVTGSDWELLALQQRYRGYFQPFIAERIDHRQPAEFGMKG
ncbi:MAG: SET domain-containing protein [Blastocatellia bacterium]